MRQIDEREQYPLANLMSDISEEAMCAGWLIDNEYILWAIMTGQIENRYGFGPVAEKHIAHLKYWHAQEGGWVIWVDEESLEMHGIEVPTGADSWHYTGNYFIETEAWLKLFKLWATVQKNQGYPLRKLSPEEVAQLQAEEHASMHGGEHFFDFEGRRKAVEKLREEKGWKKLEPFYGA